MFHSKYLWIMVIISSLCLTGLVLAQNSLADHAIWGVTITGNDTPSDYAAQIPRVWINSNANHAAFTIDLSSNVVQLESCLYQMGHILVRQGVRYRVKIIDNATGTILGQKDFWGQPPPYCPYSYGFFSSMDFITGDSPNKPEDLQKWLKGYQKRLTPPTATPAPDSTLMPLADGTIFGVWLKFDKFTPQEERLYRSVLPPEWTARSENEAAYSISLSYVVHDGGKCYFEGYSPSTSLLRRKQVTVEIRDTKNNKIGSTVLYGAYPECPDSPPSSGDTLGELPYPAQFMKWLSKYSRPLTPPTATMTPTLVPTPTLTPTPLAVPANAPQVIVTSKTANLRAAPSTSAAIVAVARNGQSLKVIGRNKTNDWVQVISPDEEAAWVFVDLINLNGLDVTSLPIAQ